MSIHNSVRGLVVSRGRWPGRPPLLVDGRLVASAERKLLADLVADLTCGRRTRVGNH